MTTRADFDERQWQVLLDAPRCAAMGVVVVDFGLVDFAKEAAVMVRFAQQAQAMYAHNALIQDVLAETTSTERTTGWHLPWRDLDKGPDPSGRSRPERIAEQLLDKVADAVSILDRRAAPDEAKEFKEFLFAYADRVARASGEGFLGGGEPVSFKEAAFLRRLEEVLG
ncbi:MAG: hypothetical protein JRI23_33325, partial [Deltaproteobacteria bacterium]|nr:hypothetical protein [Deltaproteobacteria bacterium]MBW2537160.1 hypothetical protein [Deltaproteobacteria bacterium]